MQCSLGTCMVTPSMRRAVRWEVRKVDLQPRDGWWEEEEREEEVIRIICDMVIDSYGKK